MASALSHDNPHTAIIKDYIAYKLRCQGIIVPGYDHEPECVSEVCKTLRRVCEELEANNRELFTSMCDQLNITPNTAYPTFQGIADEIFQSGKNWGRIVAFICFGAQLAVHCANREEELGPQFVDNVVNWISRYMSSHLDNWLTAHKSWVRNFAILISIFLLRFSHALHVLTEISALFLLKSNIKYSGKAFLGLAWTLKSMECHSLQTHTITRRFSFLPVYSSMTSMACHNP